MSSSGAAATPPSVNVVLAGVELQSFLLNEPDRGPISIDEARVLLDSQLGAVVTRPMAEHAPAAHPWQVRQGSYKLSAAEAGIVEYDSYAEVLEECVRGNKPVIAVVTGRDADELTAIARLVGRHNVEFVQIDLSQRTAPTGRYSDDSRVLGLQADSITLAYEAVRRALREDVRVGIRQPIKLDAQNVVDIAHVAESLGVAFVTVAPPINIGMLVDVDTETSVLPFGQGESPALGRVSGPAMRPLYLANIHIMRNEIGIPLVGSGGATDGASVVEYVLTGATAVELDVPEETSVARRVEEILEDSVAIFGTLGYQRVKDAVGKVMISTIGDGNLASGGD